MLSASSQRRCRLSRDPTRRECCAWSKRASADGCRRLAARRDLSRSWDQLLDRFDPRRAAGGSDRRGAHPRRGGGRSPTIFCAAASILRRRSLQDRSGTASLFYPPRGGFTRRLSAPPRAAALVSLLRLGVVRERGQGLGSDARRALSGRAASSEREPGRLPLPPRGGRPKPKEPADAARSSLAEPPRAIWPDIHLPRCLSKNSAISPKATAVSGRRSSN